MGSPWERQSRMAMSRPRRSQASFPPIPEQASCAAAQPAQGEDQEEDLSKLPKYFSWEQQPAGSGDPWAQMAANSSWGQGGSYGGGGSYNPATQAAQQFVQHANETAAARRLRKLQEKNEARGGKRVRWGQFNYNNPHQRQLPDYLAQVGSGPGERSVLVIDTRDQRFSGVGPGRDLHECPGGHQRAV